MCCQLAASEKPLVNGYSSWLLGFRHQFVFVILSRTHTYFTTELPAAVTLAR